MPQPGAPDAAAFREVPVCFLRFTACVWRWLTASPACPAGRSRLFSAFMTISCVRCRACSTEKVPCGGRACARCCASTHAVFNHRLVPVIAVCHWRFVQLASVLGGCNIASDCLGKLPDTHNVVGHANRAEDRMRHAPVGVEDVQIGGIALAFQLRLVELMRKSTCSRL